MNKYIYGKGGYLGIARLLVEKGANVNHVAKSGFGYTALILASKYGYIKAVKFLIEKGANINHKNNVGKTALMRARENRNLKAVKFLTDIEGYTLT